MKTARLVVILAIAAALIFVMYRLRPKTGAAPPAGQNEVAAVSDNTSPPATAPVAERPAEENDNLPELIPLPLAPVAIEAENGMWRTNSDYQIVPHGTQSFGGIEFVFDGLLQLQSTSSEAFNRSYRTNIPLAMAEAGAVGRRFGSLHLVCGTRWWSIPGAQLATLIWHYADGQSRTVPIVHQQHVRDWVRPPYEEPAHLPYKFSKVIWHSANVAESGRWQRLYRTSLPNPDPKKAVAGVELVSSRAEATLIVLAATLDRLPPGTRPDDSPDLEPTDIAPPQYLQVLVVDNRSLPVAGAQLRVQSYPNSAGSPASTKYLTSDRSGAMTVAFPPSGQRRLELAVSHDDYGSRKMAWDLKAGDQVPSTCTFKLGEAITIGGIVVNQNSEPVMDAKLTFWRYWSGGERPDAKGEQPDFSNRTVSTDAGGMWQLKAVPTEMIAHIGFGIKHTDYPATNITFRGDEETEKQLRAGTFKIVLGAGMTVAGRVLDEAENPIANATVASGRRYSNSRQQVTTDTAGKFTLTAIEQGNVPFNASADGFAAETKTINVRSGMPEIAFHLKPGHSIRGIVQNENSEPVSGVRVVLEDTRFGNNDGPEFSTTTGDNGRFEWKSAPNEPKAFYIGKQGYEQIRNKMLDVDVENVVTLRKPRQVEGYVLDAESGQPITKFSASFGQAFETDRFFPSSRDVKEFSDPNGHFTIEIDDQLYNGVRVEAKDYAAQVKDVGKEERISKVEFRLKPSAALQGIVVSPDGQPQPGVQVAITQGGNNPGNNVRLRAGKMESYGQSRIVTTDANGAFILDSPPETGGKVFAAGGSGYGSATVDEVRASGRVVLQDYGQIEGTLKIGGAPASGQELFFTMFSSGINTDFDNFKVATDDDGRFKFTKLPAGDGEVVRLIRTSPNSWTHSHKTNVTVVAGQTLYISLGDSGALLKGTARLQVPWSEDEKLIMGGYLSSKRPMTPNFNSVEESRAFYRSAEWQAQMKTQQNFAVAVAADGSFSIDSVPPGSYTLNVSAARPSTTGPPMMDPVASGSLEVTVPDNPNPFSPIQLGEVVLLSRTNSPQRFPGR